MTPMQEWHSYTELPLVPGSRPTAGLIGDGNRASDAWRWCQEKRSAITNEWGKKSEVPMLRWGATFCVLSR